MKVHKTNTKIVQVYSCIRFSTLLADDNPFGRSYGKITVEKTERSQCFHYQLTLTSVDMLPPSLSSLDGFQHSLLPNQLSNSLLP